VYRLIFGGCEHSRGLSGGVCGDLEVLEDRVGQFEAGASPLAIQEFCPHACPEGLHHAVVVGVTDPSHREREPSGLDPLAEGPGRELASVNAMDNRPVLWFGVLTAIVRALVTSEVA
jgi:hypothetical protein